MLSLPSRKTIKLFSRPDSTSSLVPVQVNKTLPSPVRSLDLGRLTSPSEGGEAEVPTNQTTLPQIGIANELQEHMTSHADPDILPNNTEEWPRDADSYWSTSVRRSSWKATIGHVLHQSQQDPQTQQYRHLSLRQESLGDQAPIFSPQTPGLSTLLSYFKRPPGPQSVPAKPLSSQIIARLVPSPFTKGGIHNLIDLPKIEFIFNFEDANPPSGDRSRDQKSSTSPSRVVFDIDASTVVTLTGANAILHETVFDAPLPEKVVDVRFARQVRVKALVHKAMDNENIRAFVEAIVNSIKAGGDLRAPQYLQVKLDRWMVPKTKTDDNSATSQREEDAKSVEYTYFFAGFEYRGRRRYAPNEEGLAGTSFSKNFVLDVHDVEAGLSGGRRTEVFVQQNPNRVNLTNKKQKLDQAPEIAKRKPRKPASESTEAEMPPAHVISQSVEAQTNEDTAELVSTAFAIVEMVSSVHKGTLVALKQKPVRFNVVADPEKRLAVKEAKEDRKRLRAARDRSLAMSEGGS